MEIKLKEFVTIVRALSKINDNWDDRKHMEETGSISSLMNENFKDINTEDLIMLTNIYNTLDKVKSREEVNDVN